METFTTSNDPLEQEIAAREADIARNQASIADLESKLLTLKQTQEILAVEVRTLKRAAGLRPTAVLPVAEIPATAPVRAVTPPAEAPAPALASGPIVPAGRFREVVNQIRAGR